ncbi:hypothetical protein L873DRAFT_1693889 [Choiromyces venosus 120613-1]|uniref:TFIIS N-terminal domain-containing protein n=1 Tax=Choiromyces venosus 120613-1 TaxID=1336337 RepID=A0A3N4JIM6_9PEZI|nr:hypothetical protein L873DRAFT_1693889 [Choiromyces venosus 120613-1]
MDTADVSNSGGLVGAALHGGVADSMVQGQPSSSSQAEFVPYQHQLVFGPGTNEYSALPESFPHAEYNPYPSSEAWNAPSQPTHQQHAQHYTSLDPMSHFAPPPHAYPQQFTSHNFSTNPHPFPAAGAVTTSSPQIATGALSTPPTVQPHKSPNIQQGFGPNVVRNLTTSTPNAATLTPNTMTSTTNVTASTSKANAEIRVKGCPNITVRSAHDPSLQLPPDFLKLISSVVLGNEPLASVGPPKKNQKVINATSTAKVQPVKSVAPSKPKLPEDPVEKIRYQIEEALEFDDDDNEDIRKASKQVWDVIIGIRPEQSKLVEVAVRTILKVGDNQILRALGESILFSIRLRKWMTTEWNRDRNSPTLLHKFCVSEEDLEQSSWIKALKSIGSKSEDQKTKDICMAITRSARERSAKKEREEKAKEKQQKPASLAASSSLSDRTNDKEKSLGNGTAAKSEASSSVNVGIKRKSEDDAKVGQNTIKKLALGEGKIPAVSSSLNSKTSLSTGNSKNAATSTVEKKLTTSTSSSTGANGSSASAKPKTTTSGFFKSLQGNRPVIVKAPTKPVERKATPNPESTPGTFTSIFDQLVRQQKEGTTGLRPDSDTKKREADEDQNGSNKKIKKKKTVRWKTGEDLARVKVIEWVEPEGEYYGGSSGHENHEYGNARNFDVEEGREALAALKNRNFLEDEEDLLDWYQPLPLDFGDLHRHVSTSADNAISRGGKKEITSEEAKIQSKRELQTLSALYTSAAAIPDSPQEPDSNNDGSQEFDQQPTIIPLPDNLKPPTSLQTPFSSVQQNPQPAVVPDISSILSAINSYPQPPQSQSQATANDILAQIQAITRGQQQPTPPPAVPFAQPVAQQIAQAAPASTQQPDLSSILMALGPNSGQQQQAGTSLLQNLVQQGSVAQGDTSAALTNILAQMSSNPAAFSFGQAVPNAYDTSNSHTWPTYESQLHQPYGNTSNHSNQSPWAAGSGTDEFGRTLRESDREKEGRGGKDVRGALREAAGWDERKSEVERHNGSGNNGNEPTRGGWSGGKHKKVKRPHK